MMLSPSLVSSEVRERLAHWWECGEHDTPGILAAAVDSSGLPDTDDLTHFWMDADFVTERTMRRIDQTTYYGLATPYHYVDLGSSAMAGVLGCPLEYIDKETIWAHPCCESLEQVLDITLDPNNAVYAKLRELTARSAARAHGHHYVAPFALEGMTDLLAALRGIENFLMDLVCEPELTQRAMAHLKELWLTAFRDIQQIIAASGNDGGIGWAGIWAPGTTFPLQEDVAYNISPEMFRTFCLPQIDEMAQAMDYAFFHLDGIGMLPHLDSLLELQSIKAIQWQPGAGKERLDQWYDVIRRIVAGGKAVQVYAQADEVDALVNAVGTKGLMIILHESDRDTIERVLERYPQ